MKVMTILLVGILLVTPQVFAELSVSDLEKISQIVKESETHMKEYVSGEIEKVNIKITEMDKRLTNQINTLDKRLTNQINTLDKRLTNQINTLEKQFTIGINALDTQVGRNHNLIIAFIALIVFAVGIPQLITVFQGRKLREQADKYNELKKDLEMLKQQQTVRP